MQTGLWTVDDLVESQSEIDRTGDEVPELAVKDKFYQELRGYVTDLTDCYDEKVGTITYLGGGDHQGVK